MRFSGGGFLGFERPTFYFRYCGEINTETVLKLARVRAAELGVEKIVVVSETGRSALKALEVLTGTKVELIVVTHFPERTWGPKGDIPIGLGRPEYLSAKRCLEGRGVVTVQGTRPLASVARSVSWEHVPEALIDKTLELFGSGTKVAVEAAVMATDAGAVDRGEIVITTGGTFKGLDIALVVKTTYSSAFFKEFEVLEIIAKPHKPRVTMPNSRTRGGRVTWRSITRASS